MALSVGWCEIYIQTFEGDLVGNTAWDGEEDPGDLTDWEDWEEDLTDWEK